MTEQDRPSIADNQRSPASEAAEKVPFGSSERAPEDEREEPKGSSEAAEPKTDDEGKPVVPPSRQTH